MAREKSWSKWVLILVVLGALGGGGYRYWKKSQTERTEYKSGTVARGDLIQVVTASGQLNPVVTVQVGSQISGILQKLYVDFNSPVTNGQIVAQIDPASYKANVQQAEAELDSAKAALELTRLNAERAKALFTDTLLPKADYDKSIADLHQSESTVKIRQAVLEKAKARRTPPPSFLITLV